MTISPIIIGILNRQLEYLQCLLDCLVVWRVFNEPHIRFGQSQNPRTDSQRSGVEPSRQTAIRVQFPHPMKYLLLF